MWTVEPARPEQADEILAVQHEAFRENQKRYRIPLPELQEGRAEVEAAIAEGKVLVARQGDEVIGALRLTVDGSTATVSHVSVLPAYAHLAVGRSLMTAAEKAAKAKGAREVVLETGLRDAPAIEFYLKLGYRPVTLVPDDENEYDQVRFRKAM